MRFRLFGMALVLALVSCPHGIAQGPPSLEFSFSNPGARSMGFGGAFVALADDATAAFANPAGLQQLVRPEVSLELRRWSYDTPYTAGGRVSGEPTEFGIDTTTALRFGVSSEATTGISFVSFVQPLGKWTIAVYPHQLAKFQSDILTGGFFEAVPDGTFREFDQRVMTSLDLETSGFSTTYRVSDRFSAGVGLSYMEGALLFTTGNYFPDGFFDEPVYRPQNQLSQTVVEFDDSDWGLTAGFLWQISSHWRIGGACRQGPAFKGNASVYAGALLEPETPAGTLLESISGTPIAFPDVYGVGAVFQSESLTVSLEWTHVEYSTIVESLDPEQFDDLPVVDDADELHVGFEYVFLRPDPVIALRLGSWLDPDHRFRADGGGAVFQAFFQPGDDEVHVAAGLGLAWRSFQLDIAVDRSDLVDTSSLSAIYRF
ncbi:MAG: outer membrane protein transport protein [Acidobacteriota bacterium]|nr:MAG: outer membrane protein transport protein [Acidobacteriota bacterium]